MKHVLKFKSPLISLEELQDVIGLYYARLTFQYLDCPTNGAINPMYLLFVPDISSLGYDAVYANGVLHSIPGAVNLDFILEVVDELESGDLKSLRIPNKPLEDVLVWLTQNGWEYENGDLCYNGWELDYWLRITHPSRPDLQLSGSARYGTASLTLGEQK